MNVYHEMEIRKNVKVYKTRNCSFIIIIIFFFIEYEQNIITWMEDSITSICASCSKSFGLFGRKHHCRLDGLVICTQCSRFLSFSIARKFSFYYFVFGYCLIIRMVI
jgi:hypothetical protein